VPGIQHVFNSLFELLRGIHHGFGRDPEGTVLKGRLHQGRIAFPAVVLGPAKDLGSRCGNPVLKQMRFGYRLVGRSLQGPGVCPSVGKTEFFQNRWDLVVGIRLSVQPFAPIEDQMLPGVETAQRLDNIGVDRSKDDLETLLDEGEPHPLNRQLAQFAVDGIPVGHHVM
jgi:hypothetical protein